MCAQGRENFTRTEVKRCDMPACTTTPMTSATPTTIITTAEPFKSTHSPDSEYFLEYICSDTYTLLTTMGSLLRRPSTLNHINRNLGRNISIYILNQIVNIYYNYNLIHIYPYVYIYI